MNTKTFSTLFALAFLTLSCGVSDAAKNAPPAVPPENPCNEPGKVSVGCDSIAFADGKTPLTAEQKVTIKNFLGAVTRTMTAFNYATDRSGILTDEGTDQKVKTMAIILKKDCNLTVQNAVPGDKNPKSIKKAQGPNCPVDMNHTVANQNETAGYLEVQTDWKYSVLTPDYKHLNDTEMISVRVNQTTKSDPNLRQTSDIKLKRDGTLGSVELGRVLLVGSGAMRISDTGGKHDVKGTFRTQLQFKDFVLDLREEINYEGGKLNKLFYFNGQAATEEEVEALVGDSALFTRSY